VLNRDGRSSIPRSGSVWLAGIAAALVTVVPAVAAAFPLADGSGANHVLGQGDYTTGFVDFASDPFFGARSAAANSFFYPVDAAYDERSDRLFVADMHNHRVLGFDVPGAVIDGMNATLVLGQPDFTTGGAVGSDPYGNSNTPNAANGCTTAINACGMHRVWAVDFDSANGRLFVVDMDNNRVLVWDLSGAAASGMPAAHVLGQPDFQTETPNTACGGGDSGPVNACGLSDPFDVEYDEAGQRLLVADSGNNRVVVYDLAGGITDGMPATTVLGQTSLNAKVRGAGCDGAASATPTACGLDHPSSVVVDAGTGRLYVGDTGASRILVYDLAAGLFAGMPAANVLGQPDFSTGTPNTGCDGSAGGDTGATACGLGIYGVELERDVNRDVLYAADVANNRVLVYDVSVIDDGEPAAFVLGYADFTSGYEPAQPAFGGSTSRTGFVLPGGLAYDPVGDRLFVTDGGNHRVLSFGANVGGVPLVVEGGDGTAIVNDDGSTTVDVTGDDGSSYTVTFPPGTTAPPGDDEVTIQVESSSNPQVARTILIYADLPPGTTKSATVERGSSSIICVSDHDPDKFKSSCGPKDNVKLPDPGQCTTDTVTGDLGDNPDDPSDPDGLHEVSVCVSDDNSTVTLSQLLHTELILPPGHPDPEEALLDDNGLEPPETAPPAAGCRLAAGRTGSGAGALLLLLLLSGLAARERTAPARARVRRRR
jgi:hypothetical protein